MAKEGENFDIYDDSFIHYDNHLNDVDDIYSDMKIDKTISINLNSTPTNTFDKVFFFFHLPTKNSTKQLIQNKINRRKIQTQIFTLPHQMFLSNQTLLLLLFPTLLPTKLPLNFPLKTQTNLLLTSKKIIII